MFAQVMGLGVYCRHVPQFMFHVEQSRAFQAITHPTLKSRISFYGKAEIDKFKKTVEGGVSDAKAIYKEVAGIWGWIAGLFSSKQPTQRILIPTASIEKREQPKKKQEKTFWRKTKIKKA